MSKALILERGTARAAVSRWLLPTLVLLFFLSGMSGLIYQTLWLRLLALVFGVTVYAASTVLASFMGGLALGSFLAGRLGDRVRNPLLWLGLAETGVGLTALATPLGLSLVEGLYTSLYPALSGAPALLTVGRFLCASAVLLVPTTLMGASLPLIVKSSLFKAEGLGERVGLLYGTNTAGAIVGTLLAGFFLIGNLGIRTSFGIAAALDLFVGLTAIAIALTTARGEQLAVESRESIQHATRNTQHSPDPPSSARRLVLVVFTLSGFTSLALEVVWFRVLVLFIEGTTYAFTIMLATVLAGIALGSYLVTPLMRRRWNWLAGLAGIELAIGLAALFSLFALTRTDDLFTQIALLLRGRVQPPYVAACFAILPATLLMGVAFPIGLRLWVTGGPAASEAGDESGSRIGLFYSLNVCGAIFGALAAGFVLLPNLGSAGTITLLGAISLASGLLLLGPLLRPRRTFALGAGTAGILIFLVAAITLPNPFALVMAQRHPGKQLLWHEEGVQTTVNVLQNQYGFHELYLDGLHQATDTPDIVKIHRRIGLLPMALHPDPREALVIGLGGGVTAGAVNLHAGANIDVVELSQTVADGSEWFRKVNGDVIHQPNVQLKIDDGRNYLLLTPKRYDVITADIIRPYHAGAGNLYAVEYFRIARKVLQDDGIMLQWLDPANESQYKLIMRTFISVFPDTTLWADGTLMVGTKRPLQIDRAAFERKLQNAQTRAALEAMGYGSFDQLIATYVAGPEEMRAFVGPGPLLSDDRPMIEYFRSLPRPDPPPDLSRLHGDVRRILKP